MTPINSEAAILTRVLETEVDDLSAEAAHYLLRLNFREDDLKRMDELATKSRDGALRSEELAEVENYEHVGHLLALMQSKARRSLNRAGSSS